MDAKIEDKSPFFLTYLAFRDNQKMLGHSAVGISTKNQDGTYRLIFRVGLFPTDQVQMEDFILDKTGRDFYCKHFPLDQEQLTHVLHKINSDRQLITPGKKNPENKKETSPEKQSMPGGIAYHTYLSNCKDYAMSLLKAAKVNYTSIKNAIISIPRFSGKLEKVCLEKNDNGHITIHSQGTKGYSIEKIKQYVASNKNSSPTFTAATKLQNILEGNTAIKLTKEEYKTVRSGKLGAITRDAIRHSLLKAQDIKPIAEVNKTSLYRSVMDKIKVMRGLSSSRSNTNVSDDAKEPDSPQPNHISRRF
ncbi:MAG: hypothetical protein CK424_03280 [Legionella sp.]|nr:MAG: hypothetical protein CK424_03280 [Legionella sp.]